MPSQTLNMFFPLLPAHSKTSFVLYGVVIRKMALAPATGRPRLSSESVRAGLGSLSAPNDINFFDYLVE